MRVFICRHGNTFGLDQPGGQRIFMCGSKNNIPLVESGRQQARIMAQYLRKVKVAPNAIYANHLIRTWEYAAIIKEFFHQQLKLDIPFYLDEHLLELDYGNWAGLNTQGNSAADNEVIAKFGDQAWHSWQEKRIIPNQPPHNWQITKTQIVANIQIFLTHLVKYHKQDDTIVTVGSQGSITFLNALLPGGMEQAIAENRFKIKTGHFVEIKYNQAKWQLVNWNKNPDEQI